MASFLCGPPAYFKTSLFVRPSITSQDWTVIMMFRPLDENEQSAAAGNGTAAFETVSTTSKANLVRAFPMLMKRLPLSTNPAPGLERRACDFLQSNVARSQSAGP